MRPQQNSEETDFLLGKLTEHDQELIEKGYFNDAGSFEELLIAESELFDAYAAGRLSADDNERFESRLMTTPKQRDRAAFADALAEYALRSSGAEKETLISKWKSGILQLFSIKPLLSYSLSTAALLLLAVAGSWWMSSGPTAQRRTDVAVSIPPGISDDRILEVNSPPDFSDMPAEESSDERVAQPARNDRKAKALPSASPRAPRGLSQVISTIVLTPGSVRDNGRAKVFVLPKATTRVDLKLEYDEFDHESYYAVVETADGQQVWRGKARYKDGIVSVDIPSNRITVGDYIVSLKGLSQMKTYDTVADYSFTVERK